MSPKTKVKLHNMLIILLGLLAFIIYQAYLTEEVNTKKETIPNINESKFKIYFIDVGEADSILIENNHEYTLVDAGNNKDGKKLVKYFQNLGITHFQYVIGTHAHEDHIGGMDDIIKNFTMDHFYMPDVYVSMRTYEEILEELEKKHITYETPKIDESFTMSDTNFQVLWIGDNQEDINSTSIVLKVTYKNTSYLLMSDATYEVEQNIIEKNIKSDLLKVGHHGSNHSTGAVFLKTVNPKYSVISVGTPNDYGFPKEVTLNKLNRISSEIYRTDELGTIIALSDGEEITFQFEKTDTNYQEENKKKD